MTTRKYLRRAALALPLAISAVLLLSGRLPELPSSKDPAAAPYSADIGAYLIGNLFPIVFPILAFFLGGLILWYSLHLRSRSKKRDAFSGTLLPLGVFIFLSGVWVLTDSRVLDAFLPESGGRLNGDAVSFISFLSFMLLPIVFIAFLRNLTDARGISVIDRLLLLNLTIFVALAALGAPMPIFLISLLIHHTLLFSLLVLIAFRHAHSLFRADDQQERSMARGVVLFMLFSGAALLAFLFFSRHAYAVIYCIGFSILILYMVKITAFYVTSAYRETLKLDLYKSLSYTDTLTALKNRNAFIEDQEALKMETGLCFVVLDINGLKEANDSLGHRAGDDLIRRAALAIRAAFSHLGDCYRIGGDEFAVICRNTDEAAVARALEALDREIAAVNRAAGVPLALARGYAFSSADTPDADALFVRADDAMYRDKRSGPAETP